MTLEVFFEKPSDLNPVLDVVSVYIECDDKILLLKRSPGKIEENKWGVAAGKLEENEELIDGIIRECLEETGLELKESSLEKIATAYIRNEGFEYSYHMYKTTFLEIPTITLNDEHTEYKWVTIKEALKMPLMSGAKELLKHYQTETQELETQKFSITKMMALYSKKN